MITKDFMCFMGMLIVLIGIQVFATERIYLTSQFTRALAEKTDPSISRKTWLYEAIYGEPAKIPEKEIIIPDWAGYAIMFGGSMLYLHGKNRK